MTKEYEERKEKKNKLTNLVAIELMALGEPVKQTGTHWNNRDTGCNAIAWPDGRVVDVEPHSAWSYSGGPGRVVISGKPAQPKTKQKRKWEGDGGNKELAWELDPIRWSNVLRYNEREWKCEITVSEKKTPEQMAKEIKGRFMDKYMEKWPDSVEYRNESDKAFNEYMSKRKLLEDRLQVKWQRHSDETFEVPGLKYSYSFFKQHISGAISIELRSINSERAVKLIEYMKEIAGKDGEL